MARKRSKNIILVIGILIIFTGVCIIITDYYKDKSLQDNDDIKIEEFFEIEVKQELEYVEEVTSDSTNKSQTNIEYMAVLEIPKINLKRGLVNPDSYYNNVNYNIEIINGSSMPDVENSNLILAGHNGGGYKAFLKNLDKLETGDSIFIFYNGEKYEYSLSNSYEVSKNGTVSINRDKSKNTITLITCKKNSKDKQLIYIGYLNNTSTY